jgi:hypothetical protein
MVATGLARDFEATGAGQRAERNGSAGHRRPPKDNISGATASPRGIGILCSNDEIAKAIPVDVTGCAKGYAKVIVDGLAGDGETICDT